MNNSRQLQRIARTFARQMSQAAEGQVTEVPSARFQRMKAIQKRFQIDDGLPVHLKGGFGDRILYLGTFGLTLIGVGLSVRTWIRLILKK
ncbi:hypothetical protein NQ315_007283 [Exocentrus adspersus]|uniref:Uncharacterized protein n=1 Tax=Exocentrus adspersus TaxID=1586481 RepID=A0AAV8WE11_9CUCU|nr:hypothetical protein NQ315_007283 [Exocentrus adspersus]